MKVVIASDSYKESLKAIEVCEAIERGFEAIFPTAEYVKIPIGDGGEGTVDSLVDATGENYITSCNRAALENVEAFYGMSKDKKTAFIEMAAASGLQHVPVKNEIHLLQRRKEQENLYYMR